MRYGCIKAERSSCLLRGKIIVVVALRQQSRCGCINPNSSFCLHRGKNLVQQTRCSCIRAASSFWPHRGKNLLAASSQPSRNGYIEATLSLLMNRGSKLVLAASRKQTLCCGCIKATISYLHRGSNLVVTESMEHFRCGFL